MTRYEDPGWVPRPWWRLLTVVFAPAANAGGGPPVVRVRTAMIAFVGGLLAILPVVALLFPLTSGQPVEPAVWALLTVGVTATLAGAPWARRRSLSCESPELLADSYSTTVFIGVAFAESAALLGFIASFIADAYWPYLAGAAASALGFAQIAPTSSRIARRDEQLRSGGCRHSLREAMYASD